MTSIANSSRRQSDPTLQPWSHRQPYAVRVRITIVSGVAAGIVGTLAHRRRRGSRTSPPACCWRIPDSRSISTWCARARSNAVGLGFHLIASSAAVWMLTGYGPGGDALVPVGFSGEVPFFRQHAGVIWIFTA
ncbi:MAG: alcohol dehydrogenase [Bifidobacterium pullorum]